MAFAGFLLSVLILLLRPDTIVFLLIVAVVFFLLGGIGLLVEKVLGLPHQSHEDDLSGEEMKPRETADERR